MGLIKRTFAGFALAALAVVGVARPVSAQSSPAPYTKAFRYDAGGRPTGTISAPPATAVNANFLAARNTYDSSGRLQKVETGVLASWPGDLDPSGWSGFTVSTTTTYGYDANGRKIREQTAGSDGVVTAVTHYSYDVYDRLICTAVRMDPAQWGSQTDACVPQTTGSQGADRITRTTYDSLNRPLLVQRAYGTSLQQNYATYTYSATGKPKSVADANGNKAEYAYDVFDRQVRWYFPMPTTPGYSNAVDYEEYGYDANGNRTSLRKRDGRTLTYSYDALNRMTVKTVSGACVAGYACTTPPNWAVRNVYYGYDLQGLQTSARFDSTSGADRVANAYDGFGGLNSSTVVMSGVSRTVGRSLDADGNRSSVTHPDTTYFAYDYDGLDRMSFIRQNGSTQVASYDFTTKGQPWHAARGAVLTTLGYDNAARLTSIGDDLAGTTADITSSFGYNPAKQLTSFARNNDSYAYAAYVADTKTYTVNGLNQYIAVSGSPLGYDSNGNLASNGGTSFTYDVENRLVSATGSLTTTMVYDPLGRLYQTSSGAGTRQFLYDGDERIAEYDGSSGALLRRYVHGPGDDDPQLWYEGAGLTDRRSLQVNHQGSIVSTADVSGNVLAIKAYDEYGVPSGGDVGAFQYTGQAWLPDLGMYYYKARIYSAKLGRFLQTDPVGYKDQVNLYSYIGNDPSNGRDPTGETCKKNNNSEAYDCQIDRIAEIQDGKKTYREATAEDHKKYASVEQSLTMAVNRAIYSGRTANINVASNGNKFSFSISGKEIGKNLISRMMVVDPNGKPGAMSTSNGITTINAAGIDPTGGIVGGFTRFGYAERTRAIFFLHEAIHSSIEEMAGFGEIVRYLGVQPLVDDHQSSYNQEAQYIMGPGK